jgi:uncharacterized membrane protein YdbT with pleckstrin-like domain
MLLDRIALSDHESVVRIVRKHWFVLFAQIIGIVLVWLLPAPLFGVLVMWIGTKATVPDIVLEPRLLAFLYALWSLIFGAAFYHRLTNYWLDVWVITSERIIAIDQKGLFRRSIASFRLDRLQNLDVDIDGFIPTMLDFGTLRVETAGHDEEKDFMIRGIGKPREIKSLILETAESRNGALSHKAQSY